MDSLSVRSSSTQEEKDALQAEARKLGRKLKVEVIADSSGKWCSNGMSFESVEAALEYGADLMWRWTSVREWRVVLDD